MTGKKFQYDYGEVAYQVSIKTDDTLHWKCVKGADKGREADERYKLFRINEQTLFLSWREADGLGVSQVLDFANGKVFTYLQTKKGIMPLSGTIQEIR